MKYTHSFQCKMSPTRHRSHHSNTNSDTHLNMATKFVNAICISEYSSGKKSGLLKKKKNPVLSH